MANAYRDQNSVPTLIASSNVDGQTPVRVYADPVTHRLLVDTGGAGTGITEINGDGTVHQTLTVGTTGTDFAIVDDGIGGHEFDLPTASATNRGALSSTDWTTFNNKGSGTVTAVSIATANGFSGSSSGGATPALTIVAGAIVPTSVNGVVISGSGTPTLAVTGTTTVSGANTGDQNLFSSVPVSGQTTVTASTTTTALTLVAGTNTTITTDNTAKSITINSTNGGGTVTAVSIATANGFSGSSSGGATPALTIVAGAITPTSVNGLTISTTTGTLTVSNGKTLTVSDSTTLATNAITLGGGEVITFSASNALSLLTTGSTVMTFPQATDTVVTLAATQTLTNKRVTPRVLSAASYTTDTGTSINGDTQDMFIVTAQTGALKFNNPSGTPTDGQKLIITVASSTTAARALTWDTSYGATTVALPTTTAATTATLSIGFIWSASKTLWQVVAVA